MPDVYKRQNNIDITLLSGGIYEAMITTVGGLIVGIAAVSYTHLDVYKRQDQCPILAGRRTEPCQRTGC